MGFGEVFFMALMPIMRILILCGLGALLTTTHINVLNVEARKHFNKLVFVVFTPALVFTNLALSITWEKMIAWWYIPINVLMSFLIGGSIGFVVVKICKPPPHLRRLIIACCATGNTGNLPLVLVPATCAEANNPFGSPDECNSNGVAYVSFGLSMSILLTWSLVFNLLRPPPSESYKEHTVDQSAGRDLSVLANSKLEQSVQLLPQEKSSLAAFETSHVGYTIGIEVIAIIIAVSPPVKGLLYGQYAPLRFVADAITLLGNATIPSMNLLLGGNLTQGSHSSNLKISIIVGVVLTRLVILPSIGILVIKVVSLTGILPPDPLFTFVLLLQFTMPTAINIGNLYLSFSSFWTIQKDFRY
ncbi:hypothetical protein O6H91_19G046500 [Diphasiastrum complanatum]|uniref:Uncharacterized protein n=1 Tax=Diphasiastrum complanatum TaxID=34168 RepID=A0ACC2AVN6_DIPCM|nr:hypothetical protein O6H91_19G046500 [Diphasiastrum complanatum]